ncbi:MAG: amidase [Burkholderiales bacterium]
MMSSPCELLLHEAAAQIRAGSLSPVELIDDVLARIVHTEDRLHAWVHIDAERARAAARKHQEAGTTDGVLAGIPMGFKDLYDVRGLPTAAGFAPWRDRLATDDADVVAALRSHGMIPIGKTVTTQFAFSDPPPTRNPWDLERTASGSSSGSGAAVAARQVTAALGTQTTGSNLRPAAYNGIVGFKPSYGSLSRRGIVPLAWSMDHPGILARCVRDAAILLDCMMVPRATGNGMRSGVFEAAALAPRPLRFGVLTEFCATAVPEIRAAVDGAVRTLGANGATVREIVLPIDLETIKATQWTLLQCEALELHRRLYSQEKGHYLPRMRTLVEGADTLPAWAYVKAMRMRRVIRKAVDEAFADVDCLLSPVSPDLPPLITENTTGDYSLLAAWSLLGLPAASIPIGLSVARLPLALQIAASYRRDDLMVTGAAWCESLLGRLAAPPLA